jgi:hypothetical protein
MLETIGKRALDQLHCFLNRHIVVDSHEQMDVVWHYDKIVN